MFLCLIESSALLLRSRFGSFEIFKAQDPQTGRTGPSVNEKDILPTMLDYVIEYFYPEVMFYVLAKYLILIFFFMHFRFKGYFNELKRMFQEHISSILFWFGFYLVSLFYNAFTL